MSEKPENPPAFPMRGVYEGMTLRDYFAGQALTGLLANKGYFERSFAAIDAYNLADAMLAEREKSNDPQPF